MEKSAPLGAGSLGKTMQVDTPHWVTLSPEGLGPLSFPTLYGWLCDMREEDSKRESRGGPGCTALYACCRCSAATPSMVGAPWSPSQLQGSFILTLQASLVVDCGPALLCSSVLEPALTFLFCQSSLSGTHSSNN